VRSGLCLVPLLLAPAATAGTVDFGPLVPLVTSGAFESDVDLAIDSAGDHHVVYRFNDADSEVFYLTDLSGEWSAPLRLSTDEFPDLNVHIAALAAGDVAVAWESDEGDRDIVVQRITEGLPSGPPIRLGEDLADTVHAFAATGPDRWAILAERDTPTVDELVVWEASADGEAGATVLALALNVRFTFGALAVGPDGVIHVAIRMVGLKAGSISRLMYTNNRGGSFAALTEVLPDARGADVALHVDDANTVYVLARSSSEANVRVSTDGGESFGNTVALGAIDVQGVAARPDGLDIFELVTIDALLRLHRMSGLTVDPPLDVPTIGWRAGDIEFFGGEHSAVTTGTLQFTTTAPTPMGAGPGDLDFSGHLDAADLVRLVNHLAGSRPLRAAALSLADIDQDLLVTGRDLGALVERVVGAGP
jgi:hypothetical protein